jgi:hypothetical protein
MMKSKTKTQKQPLKIWLVEITLTSGEGLQFYVSAKDQHEAYKKADGYAELAENDMLKEYYRSKSFMFLPGPGSNVDEDDILKVGLPKGNKG